MEKEMLENLKKCFGISPTIEDMENDVRHNEERKLREFNERVAFERFKRFGI